jgi:hypothetical protein
MKKLILIAALILMMATSAFVGVNFTLLDLTLRDSTGEALFDSDGVFLHTIDGPAFTLGTGAGIQGP